MIIIAFVLFLFYFVNKRLDNFGLVFKYNKKYSGSLSNRHLLYLNLRTLKYMMQTSIITKNLVLHCNLVYYELITFSIFCLVIGVVEIYTRFGRTIIHMQINLYEWLSFGLPCFWIIPIGPMAGKLAATIPDGLFISQSTLFLDCTGLIIRHSKGTLPFNYLQNQYFFILYS